MKFIYWGFAILAAQSHLITKKACYDDGYQRDITRIIRSPPQLLPPPRLPPYSKPPLYEEVTSPSTETTDTYDESTSPRGSSPDVIIRPPDYYPQRPIYPGPRIYPGPPIYVSEPNPPRRGCDRSPRPRVFPLPVGPIIRPIFKPRPGPIIIGDSSDTSSRGRGR